MIQSHYHTVVESLVRKFKTAPSLGDLLHHQFVTQAGVALHTPYALFEPVASRDLSVDGDPCMELTLHIHIITDGSHPGQSEYGAELLLSALKDRQLSLDRPFRCADLWIEKLNFARIKGSSNRATVQLKAIVETIYGV